MKKKRAIRNFVLLSIFIVLTLLLTFIPFPVLGTNYNFLGLGNLHMGLELGGGVKNTYNLEVADWYEGNKEDVYNKAVERVQYLLNLKYADAKVYLNTDDKMTIEVIRNGKWVNVNPKELTNLELCECLSNIQIDSNEFLSNQEIDEGYAAINEAIRRLSK